MKVKLKSCHCHCSNTAEHATCESCQGMDVGEDTLYDLAELFKVFGDSTRIRIISALMGREMCVLHISEALGAGQSAVSHQLRILKAAGLVRPRREGKEIYYSLDDEHVEEIYGTGLAHIMHRNGSSGSRKED